MVCSPPKSCSVDKWKSLRMTATRRKLDKMVKRNAELSVLFKRLYADNVLGKISIPSLEMVVQQMAAQTQVPSVDKGKHACQRVFPALFALFALAGASPPASQKPKITRRSIAGRCGQFCRSRNVSRRGKARREYCRIVKGLDAVWAHFCPSKPCLPSSIDGIVSTEEQAGQKEQAGSGVSRCLPVQKVRSLCVPVKDARIRRLFFCLRFRCTGAFPRWPRPRRR